MRACQYTSLRTCLRPLSKFRSQAEHGLPLLNIQSTIKCLYACPYTCPHACGPSFLERSMDCHRTSVRMSVPFCMTGAYGRGHGLLPRRSCLAEQYSEQMGMLQKMRGGDQVLDSALRSLISVGLSSVGLSTRLSAAQSPAHLCAALRSPQPTVYSCRLQRHRTVGRCYGTTE